MAAIKCPECGLVNLVQDHQCRRCKNVLPKLPATPAPVIDAHRIENQSARKQTDRSDLASTVWIIAAVLALISSCLFFALYVVLIGGSVAGAIVATIIGAVL